MNAGDLKPGTTLGISCCGCEFVVAGRDPEYPAHVLFRQVVACEPRSRCNFDRGQVLWLFDDKPIAGDPGRHSFILNPVEKVIRPG